MTSVYAFDEYRAFIRARFAQMPKKGRGQARKLANFLTIHTTLISQILRGIKGFTIEQAYQSCEFLALTETERDYFILLVQMDRAGSLELRKYYQVQAETLRRRARELVHRLPAKAKLNEMQRALFYSDWIYSAVWQLTAIKGYQSIEAIAGHFGISRSRTREILDFLVQAGFCKETSGRFEVGVTTAHLESGSVWIRVHHLNWRQKAIESMDSGDSSRLQYSAPMTLSRKDAETVREMIAKFLESISQLAAPSPSEELRCLNIDWFAVK